MYGGFNATTPVKWRVIFRTIPAWSWDFSGIIYQNAGIRKYSFVRRSKRDEQSN
jgi:hypothetical protein